jgi:predicted RNA methylase
VIRKKQIEDTLGVSAATVNNWIRTHVIPPPDRHGYYIEAVYEAIIRQLTEHSHRLSARANRLLSTHKQICYAGIRDRSRRKLLEMLVRRHEDSGLPTTDGVLAVGLAMLRTSGLLPDKPQLFPCSPLDEQVERWLAESRNADQVLACYADCEIPDAGDDLLGAFYQSVQETAHKSKHGSYYTPAVLASDIRISPDKTVLDPCCGSGRILCQVLTKAHDPALIYARDTDETALLVCHINLTLFFHTTRSVWHLERHNILFDEKASLFAAEDTQGFDYIITNPPWGSKLSATQKEYLQTTYPALATTESFSIALYNALKHLRPNGELYFFLPYSFLNTGAHRQIRRVVFGTPAKIEIKLLGKAFTKVMSEVIRLHIATGIEDTDIHIYPKESEPFDIPKTDVVAPNYVVAATSDQEDARILKAIFNTPHTTLKKTNALFGLGIVTGDNERRLRTQQDTANAEPIYRGKDIEKFRFTPPAYFIDLHPEELQQVAPVSYYRRPKIAYRFIGDRLVCVSDRSGALLLNSANFVISTEYPMETLTVLLNSDIYTFVLRKRFHPKKILKSQLQELPLPVFSKRQHQRMRKLYEIFAAGGDMTAAAEKADRMICRAFGIRKQQYRHILNHL